MHSGQQQQGLPGIATHPAIDELLAQGAVVAIGVSGGKDSSAVALRTVEYLDAIGHRGPRVLIHSDLGAVEWRGSLPHCERLAQRLGLELMVVRRAAGGLMERWEQRWSNNVERYAALEVVKLILPWSTPAMRFCTSETKADVVFRALRKRWPGAPIISVSGIRAAESAARAKMPIVAPIAKLTRKNAPGIAWHPLQYWTTDQVFEYLASRNEPLHEAYTVFRASRVSCVNCIFSTEADLRAAASCPDNHGIYRRQVALETRSTFAFQGIRWLADIAPHLLSDEEREASARARVAAATRVAAEARIPKGLLYEQGWPRRMPTQAEAELLAEVRRTVAAACDLTIRFDSGSAVMDRFADLMAQRPSTTPPVRPGSGAKARVIQIANMFDAEEAA